MRSEPERTITPDIEVYTAVVGKPARRYLWLFLWVLIPLVIWWSLRGVTLPELLETLRQLRGDRILTLAGVNALIFVLISSRWWLILRGLGHPLPLFRLIGYRLAGFGVTYFTPGPQLGGEPLQVYLLTRREGIPGATAAASVAVDKLLELIANFTFLLLGAAVILVSGFGQGYARYALLIPLAGLLILPTSYLLALHQGRTPVAGFLAWLSRRFPGTELWKDGALGARSTEQRVTRFSRDRQGTLYLAAGLSGFIWALMVVEFGLMLRFLGTDLSLSAVLTALTTARLAFLLPFPAGLGSLEAGQVMAMSSLGSNPAVGLSLALLIRGRDVLLAGLGLWLGGVLGGRVFFIGKSKPPRVP
jgi:hypothetical protein